MEPRRVLVKHDGNVQEIVADENTAFALILKLQGQSFHHATTYEGWAVERAPNWTPEEAVKIANQARYYFYGDAFHNSGGCRREGRLGRENCAQCCLLGYEPRGGFGDGFSVVRDGPNVAGWARDYVQVGMSIPRYWHAAFLAALNDDNRAYAESLARDISTFGVRFARRTWHGYKPETLALSS